ncbi:hypothetical protein FAI40_07835 [Acetobacteraceae bacterium]|nr:hypothetical protein FAI40_07835 [Acetobacteraceae bacterium]
MSFSDLPLPLLKHLLKQNKTFILTLLITTILISNIWIILHLPKQINLLGLQNTSEVFSIPLIIMSSSALLALCAFCLFLPKILNSFSLGLLAILALSLAIKSSSHFKESDLYILKPMRFFGNILPTQVYFLGIILCLGIITASLFVPFSKEDNLSKRQRLSIPFLTLFLTLLIAESYHFRHHELNAYLTEKTGLIASFSGENGGLRFLLPRAHQEVNSWQSNPKATLSTDHAGERTALLLRREFPGLLGESFAFLMVQFSALTEQSPNISRKEKSNA